MISLTAAGYDNIRKLLMDDGRLIGLAPKYPPMMMSILNSTWQWEDDTTGLPYPIDPLRGFRRHVRQSFRERAGHKNEARIFTRRMISDTEEFFVPCPTSGRQKERILGQILISEFKKIQVTDAPGGFWVEKTQHDTPLQHYTQIPPPALRYCVMGTRQTKSIPDIIQEINDNALRGWEGPGTYPCRQGSCTVTGRLLTMSPVVTWGPDPNQTWTCVKRFTCKMNNVTYLLHSHQSLIENRWTTYIGETEKAQSSGCNNFHMRVAGHVLEFCSKKLSNKYNNNDDLLHVECQKILDGEPDLESLLRDPYTHFNINDSPSDRRYTILDSDYPAPSQSRRRTHEGVLIHQLGNYNYCTTAHTGNLNRGSE